MEALADKRLVILGCGYLGSAVARQAIERGLRVTALTRNSATAAKLRAAGAEVVVAELAGSDWHDAIPGGAKYVLNAVSAGGGGIQGYRRSYVEGMRSVLLWAGTRGAVGTLVYTSSTSVYPQGEGATVDETASHTGVGERGEILLETENLLRRSEHRVASSEHPDRRVSISAVTPPNSGLHPTRSPRHSQLSGFSPSAFSHDPPTLACARYFILRLAGIYGPGRHQLLDQVRSGTVAGRGDHRLNLVHRDDICSAIWAAFAAGREVGSDIFNVADDAATPKADVVSWLAARLGVPAPVFSGLPAGTRRAIVPDRAIANGKLKRVLGWRPRYPDYRGGYEQVFAAQKP